MIQKLLQELETRLSKKVVIQKGDTLWDLATAHGVDCDRLATFNNLTRKDLILAGDTLRIPPQAPRIPLPLSALPRQTLAPSAAANFPDSGAASTRSSTGATTSSSTGTTAASDNTSHINGSKSNSNAITSSSISSTSSGDSAREANSVPADAGASIASLHSASEASGILPASMSLSAPMALPHLPPSLDLPLSGSGPHAEAPAPAGTSSDDPAISRAPPQVAHPSFHLEADGKGGLPPLRVPSPDHPAYLEQPAAAILDKKADADAPTAGERVSALRQEPGCAPGAPHVHPGATQEGAGPGEQPFGREIGWADTELALPSGTKPPAPNSTAVTLPAAMSAPTAVTVTVSALELSMPGTAASPADVPLPAQQRDLSPPTVPSLGVSPSVAAEPKALTTVPTTVRITVPVTVQATASATVANTVRAAAPSATSSTVSATAPAVAGTEAPQVLDARPPTPRAATGAPALGWMAVQPGTALPAEQPAAPAEGPLSGEGASSTQAQAWSPRAAAAREAGAAGAAAAPQASLAAAPERMAVGQAASPLARPETDGAAPSTQTRDPEGAVRASARSLAPAPALPTVPQPAQAPAALPSPLATTPAARASVQSPLAPETGTAAAAAVAQTEAAAPPATAREGRRESPIPEQQARHPTSVVISEGDCLWDIAEQYQVTLEELLLANSTNARLQSDPMLLFPGDSLALPRHARRIPRALWGIRGAAAVTRFSRPKQQLPAVTTPGQPGSTANSTSNSNCSVTATPVASLPELREREGAPLAGAGQEIREGLSVRWEERGEGRGERREEEEEEEGYSIHLKDTLPGASTFFRVFPRAKDLNIYRRRLRVLLDAMRYVETSFIMPAPSGDNGLSIGPLQISVEYHADAWWLGPPAAGVAPAPADLAPAGAAAAHATPAYAWCHDVEYAERTVINYWLRYCPWALEFEDFETLARTHNGGPAFYRHFATNTYWRKVREAMRHSGWFRTYPELDPLMQASTLAPNGVLPLLRIHKAYSPPFLDYSEASEQEESTVQ